MKPDKNIQKIKRLAEKRGTSFLEISRNGKAACFFYIEGTKIKGYSYANMRVAIPAELKRLAT
jgi:hypothetical protein